ncbi:MAG: DUF3987 domain-containing protein, partial [Burkholderiaceae bacterium]|nr:DUF3987 domain-containing protein [Burkholderiaceae bacterium]
EVRSIAEGKRPVQPSAEAPRDAEPAPEDDAPQPANILREMAAPAFELDDAPGAIARVASAFAEATGFDRAGLIVAATVAAAAAIDDRYRLAVRPGSDWFESARLWAVLIGKPSDGKSPTLRAVSDPIKDIHGDAFRRWASENKAKPEDEREAMPALFSSDATTEALSERLRDNPRGMLMLTEEFASWIGSIDAYRDGAGSRNRGEWLQLYDGGPHQVDRVKRGSFLVPNWSCSVLAACTPAGLRDQLKRLPDDGLIHRFMPVILRSPGARSQASAKSALRDWSALLWEIFRQTTTASPAVRARFSGSALALFESESDTIRQAVDAVYESSPALASHLGKHPGMLARVALVFHLVEGRRHEAIEDDTMALAIRFMRRIRRHAAAMFLGVLSSAPAYELARALARSILADDSKPRSIGRDWMRQHCRAFRSAADVERRLAIMALSDAGWLRAMPDSRAYGGWDASEWAIDLRVYDLFADHGERQRQRRETVRAMFRGEP